MTKKSWLFAIVGVSLGTATFAQQAPAPGPRAAEAAPATGAPVRTSPFGSSEIKSPPGQLPAQLSYEASTDFFKLPADVVFGEIISIAVNSKGRIAVLNHPGSTGGPIYGASTTQVLEFDKNGNFIREVGKGVYGFAYGHSVRYDRYDNLWVVDKGTSSVMKFNAEGRVVMNLGRREEGPDEHEYINYRNPAQKPPVHIDGYFNEPSDIAWDKDDNIYVSDGYKNNRVAKFDKDGNWIKSWGSRGPGPGQFSTAHNIGIDRDGNVYVADRGNRRIEVFDLDGNFKRQFKLIAPFNDKRHAVLGPTPFVGTGPEGETAPWTICLTNGPTQYLYTSDAEPGRVLKYRLDGTLVGVWGESGRIPGKLGWVHGMACPSDDELYLAEAVNWRVTRLTTKRK